jgi:hypothetical protein
MAKKSPGSSVCTGYSAAQGWKMCPMVPSCIGISSACATVLPRASSSAAEPSRASRSTVE